MNKILFAFIAFLLLLTACEDASTPPTSVAPQAQAATTAQAVAASATMAFTQTVVAQAAVTQTAVSQTATMVAAQQTSVAVTATASAIAQAPPPPPAPAVNVEATVRAQVQATMAAQPRSTAVAQATSVPSAPQPTMVPAPPGPVASSGSCEGMHDYSPKGKIELSSFDGFVHLQYWRVGQDDFELETLLPPGRYAVRISNLDGHVWELGPSCSAEQALTKHVGTSIQRRLTFKANNKGYVHWQKLISDGILSVIAQKDPIPTIPGSVSGLVSSPGPATGGGPAPAAPTASAGAPGGTGASCDGVEVTSGIPVPPGRWAIGGDDHYWTINVWSNKRSGAEAQAEKKLLLKPGEKHVLNPASGSAWKFGKDCGAAAEAEFNKNRKSPTTIAEFTELTGATATRR